MIQKEIVINGRATLTTYLLKESMELQVASRPCILIFPGGGYSMVSDREAEPVALCFNQAGFNALVFSYTVKQGFHEAYKDAEACLHYVLEHKKELHINGLALCGFSAGAHLACAIATKMKEKPDGMILAYPPLINKEWEYMCPDAIDLLDQIDEKTPQAFIVHAYDDPLVPVHNAYRLMKALDEHCVPFEAHIYPKGGHGFSIGNESVSKGDESYFNNRLSSWVPLCIGWVKEYIGQIKFEEKEALKAEDIPTCFQGISLNEAVKEPALRAVLLEFNPIFMSENFLKLNGAVAISDIFIKAGFEKENVLALAKQVEAKRSIKK